MENIPKHIVLFPDGNRRWARIRNLPTIEGHKKGYENLINFSNWLIKRGVKILTAFGFSTENWNRPKEEVEYLMKLFEERLSDKNYIKKAQKEGVKIKIIGQKERLSLKLQKIIQEIEKLTENGKNFHLNLAVSYGGRWDILEAVKKIIKDKIPPERINEDLFEKYLSTSGLLPPDLIIRAGGEKRLSNFLLWQSAYAELYFSQKLWPDFTENDLDEALKEYQRRQRRFGR